MVISVVRVRSQFECWSSSYILCVCWELMVNCLQTFQWYAWLLLFLSHSLFAVYVLTFTKYFVSYYFLCVAGTIGLLIVIKWQFSIWPSLEFVGVWVHLHIMRWMKYLLRGSFFSPSSSRKMGMTTVNTYFNLCVDWANLRLTVPSNRLMNECIIYVYVYYVFFPFSHSQYIILLMK